MTLANWVNPGVEQRALQIKELTAKLEESEAEVERLKAAEEGYGEVISDLAGQIKSHEAHTWQQERAAVVALAAGWIDAISPSPNEQNECMSARCEVLSELICIIEAGDHWKEGGTP